ncbi:hypothetical protein DFJ73DRAFT_795407 [Zopfochytrium polystomum]|nr:hypothetical protein DFJ73DRAFT_795407 [Zopfochytrium polystomum]
MGCSASKSLQDQVVVTTSPLPKSATSAGAAAVAVVAPVAVSPVAAVLDGGNLEVVATSVGADGQEKLEEQMQREQEAAATMVAPAGRPRSACSAVGTAAAVTSNESAADVRDACRNDSPLSKAVVPSIPSASSQQAVSTAATAATAASAAGHVSGGSFSDLREDPFSDRTPDPGSSSTAPDSGAAPSDEAEARREPTPPASRESLVPASAPSAPLPPRRPVAFEIPLGEELKHGHSHHHHNQSSASLRAALPKLGIDVAAKLANMEERWKTLEQKPGLRRAGRRTAPSTGGPNDATDVSSTTVGNAVVSTSDAAAAEEDPLALKRRLLEKEAHAAQNRLREIEKLQAKLGRQEERARRARERRRRMAAEAIQAAAEAANGAPTEDKVFAVGDDGDDGVHRVVVNVDGAVERVGGDGN